MKAGDKRPTLAPDEAAYYERRKREALEADRDMPRRLWPLALLSLALTAAAFAAVRWFAP